MKTEKYRPEDIGLIKERLTRGDIIAFPTDTVFGLACVYDDEEAIEKIYEAKGRALSKALPMMCSDKQMTEKYTYVDEKSGKLMDVFSPGAMTYILDKREDAGHIDNGFPTIAVRIPNDDWIRELIREMGKPLLVTSANLSNTASLKRWEEVLEELDGRIDGIVMKDAKSEVSSTIVDVREEVKILREGEIKEKEISEVLR
ncbi:MAG: threonylcarbamoyl-AMP synthase [Erysipelotrichaceae bacterium]|nr:threonylcarbamoyl-AMP synthase [Erysipelotrichaceae bacterium]